MVWKSFRQLLKMQEKNAEINGIDNAEFFVGKAEEVLPAKYKEDGVYADVIVVDPPRKGCDGALIETMLSMKPERIVYVSCDSATLARDLKVLCEKEYQVEKVAVCGYVSGKCACGDGCSDDVLW